MATMLRPNRNCCWVGQPDPTAWKKPTGDGYLGCLVPGVTGTFETGHTYACCQNRAYYGT